MKTVLFCGIQRSLMISALITLVLHASGSDKPAPSGLRGTAQISGSVFDRSTRKPVEYANIVLYRVKDSTMINGSVADSTGRFRIMNIPRGEYYLASSFIGYGKKIIPGIRIREGKEVVVLDTLFLEQAAGNLKEVNVVASQDAVETHIDKKIVNAGQQLNAAGGTAVDLLRNISTVNVDAEGNVSIRGSSNFRLLIDGRPAPVQGSDGLQQIAASTVDHIEIITNPSAKYDPDGTAGIVNVIMKKGKSRGISGGANASAGWNSKFAGDAMVNIRGEKASMYAGIDLQSRYSHPYSSYNRENYYADTVKYTDYDTYRNQKPVVAIGRAGLDYKFDTANTVSVSADYNRIKYDRKFTTRTKERFVPGDSTAYTRIDDRFALWMDYLTANLNYTHSFPRKGHEISLNATYSLIGNHTDEMMNKRNTASLYEPVGASTDNKSAVRNHRDYIQLKADYTLPFGNDCKLEAGLLGESVSKTTSFLYTDFDPAAGQWITDTLLTNDIGFTQAILAGYTTLGGKLWNIEWQAGLRMEWYSRTLDQKTTKTRYPMDMINFFPTFRLTKTLPAGQDLQLAYSRRVNRPDDRLLNPFSYFSDAFTTQSGNPHLKPEFIDSYELNYEKNFKWGNLTAETYYRHTHDVVSTNMVMVSPVKLWLYPENFGNDYTLGLDLGGNITLFKWWKLVPGVSLSNYTQEATLDDVNYHTNNNLLNARLTTTFIIHDNTRLQVNASYNSPYKLIEGDFASFYTVSASARQDFLRKKLSLTVTAGDIFQTGYSYFDNRKQSFRVYGAYYPEAPVVMLTVSYKLNDFKPRQKNQGPSNLDSGI